MFELENGDVLVYRSKTESENPVSVVIIEGEKHYVLSSKTEDEAMKLITKTVYQTDGLTRFSDHLSIMSMPDGDKIESHTVWTASHRNCLDYQQEFFTKQKTNTNHTISKTTSEISKSAVKHQEHTVIWLKVGDAETRSESSGEGNGFFLCHNFPTEARTGFSHFIYGLFAWMNPGDFAPLLPFEEGKTFNFQKPVSYKTKFKDKSSQKISLPTGETSEGAWEEVRDGTISGQTNIDIHLKSKTSYQITDDETIEAFEFEANYDYSFDYTVKVQKVVSGASDSEPETKSGSYKGKFNAEGIVAFIGLPWVVEGKSNVEFDWDGRTTQFNSDYNYRIKRAKERAEPETLTLEQLIGPIGEIQREFSGLLKETSAISEEATLEKTTPKEEAEVIEEEPAPLETEPKEAEEPLEVEEVIEERPSSDVEEKPAPEPPHEPAPEELPMPPAEEVLPWIREIEGVRQHLAKRLQTPQDIAKAFFTGQHQLTVNPVIRKALLAHISETLGLSHPQLEADLLVPVEDLMDAPIDYLGELLEQFRDPAAKTPSLDSKAQRERDVARLESAISETIDELIKTFGENHEAWEELRGHLEISPEAPVTDALFEMVLKTPSKILGAFESLQLGSATLQAFLKGNQMTQLRNRLNGLRKKLELVRQGILINPSI